MYFDMLKWKETDHNSDDIDLQYMTLFIKLVDLVSCPKFLSLDYINIKLEQKLTNNLSVLSLTIFHPCQDQDS